MKKALTILILILLILSCTACAETTPAPAAQQPAGAPTAEAAVAPDAASAAAAFVTLGDILEYDSPASSYSDDVYIHVFHAGDVFYRAEADITAEIAQGLSDIDFFDPDKDQKARDLLGDLPIRNLYNLSSVLLSQAELDALVGKTGQDLLNAGFVPSGSYGFGDGLSMAFMEKGPFEYQFDFTEVPELPNDDPNVAEVIRPLVVKAASFHDSLSSYASDLEFDLSGGRSLEEYEAFFAPEPEPVFYSIPEVSLEESPFKTLADVFAARGEHYSSSLSPDKYAIAFDVDGAYYRVEADVAPEVAEQADAIDFFDEERDQKLKDLLGPLPVTRVADLSAAMPAQEALDAFIGMTGQDLLDAGFAYGSGYSFWDKAEMYLVQGLYEYHVFFNEKVPEMDDYEAALDELMPTLTVDKVEFFQLADVCSDPDLLW